MQDFVIIGKTKLPVLLAITEEEQQIGLMGKKWPPPNMAFVYSYPRINKFWMKNTICPLDIIFAKDNKILNIFKGEPLCLVPIGDNVFSDLVVELPYGTSQQLNLKSGDFIKLEPSFKSLARF